MTRPAVCGKPSFLGTCALLVMGRLPENVGLTSRPRVGSYTLMLSSPRRGSGLGKSFRSRPFFTFLSGLGACGSLLSGRLRGL